MAKVKGALLSMEASGAFAKRLIYTNSIRGQNVTNFHSPSGIAKGGQVAQRSFFKDAKDAWNLLSLNDKLSWNIKANAYKLTGYNLFIKEFKNYNSMILIGKDIDEQTTTALIDDEGAVLNTVTGLNINPGSEIEVHFKIYNKDFGVGSYGALGLRLNNSDLINILDQVIYFSTETKNILCCVFKLFLPKDGLDGSMIPTYSEYSQIVPQLSGLGISNFAFTNEEVITDISLIAGTSDATVTIAVSDLRIYSIYKA